MAVSHILENVNNFMQIFEPALCELKPNNRLCIKVGRGQGDGDIGTRVRGLGTWGRETRDLGTSSMGRGDAGTSKTRTQGTRDVNDYCKSRR